MMGGHSWFTFTFKFVSFTLEFRIQSSEQGYFDWIFKEFDRQLGQLYGHPGRGKEFEGQTFLPETFFHIISRKRSMISITNIRMRSPKKVPNFTFIFIRFLEILNFVDRVWRVPSKSVRGLGHYTQWRINDLCSSHRTWPLMEGIS